MSELPLLIFDGDCGFCTTSAQWVQRRLRLPRVEPWQRLDLAALGVTERACSSAVQWIGPDGERAAGELAVSAAMRWTGGAWAVGGRAIELPVVRQVAAVAYRLVARYRYRLPGGTPACRL